MTVLLPYLFGAFSFLTLESACTTPVEFFVSIQFGRDEWCGRSPHPVNNSGPFQTLQRAQKAVRACSRDHKCFSEASSIDVRISSGVYELKEPLIFSALDSGRQPNFPVRWIGEEGVFISGGTSIRNWTTLPGRGLWIAAVPDDVRYFNQFFVSGRRRVRARSPDLGNYKIWKSPLCHLPPRQKHNNCSEHSRYGFVYDGSDVPSEFRNPSRVEFVVYHGWTASRHHLRQVFGENRTVIFTNPSDRPIGAWANHDSEGGGRYYIDNTFEGLDAEGEWYYDEGNSKVLYWPMPGDNIEEFEAIVSQQVEVLCLNGTTNVEYHNMSVEYSQWVCGESEVCDRQSTEWQSHAAIHLINVENIGFHRLSISHHGPYAVWVDAHSRHVSIDSCVIEDLGTGGIRVGSNVTVSDKSSAVQNILIYNCTIKDGGWVFPSGTGIFIQYAYNVNATRNEISFFSYTGVSIGWSWNFNNTTCGNHYIGFNHVNNLGLRRELGDAMACFYTLGLNNDTQIVNNLCHDVYGFYTGGYCLSQDQGSSGILMEKNVCLRVTASPQNQHYGENNVYRNNMFLYGYTDSWTKRNPGGLRTSPQIALPDSFVIENNVVVISNHSALLFDGNWNDSNPNWSYSLDRNLYWSTVSDLSKESVFGGCSTRLCGIHAYNYTLEQWQRMGQDSHSVVADPGFADPHYYDSLNFTLADSSPALKLGFQQIDLSKVGPSG